MKKIFTCTLVAMAALLLAACSSDKRPYAGVHMDDPEQIAQAFTLVADSIIREGDAIYKIEFKSREGKGVTKYAGTMTLYVFEGECDTMRKATYYLVHGDKGWEIDDRFAEVSSIKREQSVKLAEIDYSNISKYLKEAGDMVVAAGVEYEEPLFYSGVGRYTMVFNKDPKNAMAEFTVESIDTAKSTANMDRFWEFEFEVVDGKLISKDI